MIIILKNLFTTWQGKIAMFMAGVAAGGTMLVLPAVSSATETETKVGEVATQVGSEGVAIVLAILTALIGLLVAIIIIPKAVALIRRFV